MRSSLTSPPNLLLSSRPGVCVCIQKQAPHFPQFLTFSLKFFSVPFIHPSFFFFAFIASVFLLQVSQYKI